MGRDLSAENADGKWHLPLPATYVIGKDGRVELVYVDPEYRIRLEPEDILAALRKVKTSAAASDSRDMTA